MQKIVWIMVLVGVLGGDWQVSQAQADVVIKVRALNPLETKEMAVIHYPLPKEIAQGDILNQKIAYSLDHSEDEEPPKAQFQISFDEATGGHFIDDEIVLLPKEVVTLEVHVKDVWVIEKSRIEELYQEVDGLLEEWEQQVEASMESASEEEKGKNAETKEFALMMKGEILSGLDKIIQRQDESKIINVGVEKHMAAYEDNMEELRHIQQDVVLLANLIQFDAGESEAQDSEGNPLPEDEAQELEESQEISQQEEVQDAENVEMIQEIKTEAEEL